MTKVTVQPGVHAVVGAEQQVDGGDGQQQGGLDDGVVADGGGDERLPGEDDQPKAGVAGAEGEEQAGEDEGLARAVVDAAEEDHGGQADDDQHDHGQAGKVAVHLQQTPGRHSQTEQS